MASYSFERTLNIPIEKLWSVIGDFSKSPSPDIPITLEKQGDPKAGGAGTIRTIKIGNMSFREILDTADPPRGFTYKILSGVPVREYIGRVKFEDRSGRTLVRWSGDLKPMIPFTGGICCKIAKGMVQRFIDSVEKHHSKP